MIALVYKVLAREGGREAYGTHVRYVGSRELMCCGRQLLIAGRADLCATMTCVWLMGHGCACMRGNNGWLMGGLMAACAAGMLAHGPCPTALQRGQMAQRPCATAPKGGGHDG